MQNDGSDKGRDCTTICGDDQVGNSPPTKLDLEKQDNIQVLSEESGELDFSGNSNIDSAPAPALLTIVISNIESTVNNVTSAKDEFQRVDSPVKSYLSRSTSSREECRVCQQENEEELIDLGCKCKGGLSKAHHSCITTWFRTRGSNKCEICQEVAVNVSPPESQPSANYWVWRIDPTLRPRSRERGCFSPLWVAFSILIGGLLLDVLISITLDVSALPVNIIIGVIVVLGLGTALRLALEFCHEWSFRRVAQRVDTNANLGNHLAV